MKKKKISWVSIFFLVTIFLIFIFIIFPIYQNAQMLGEEAGALSGGIVGTAIGSYTGVTEKFPEGLEDGKAEGLSAKDTKVEIKNTLSEVNKLEVLVASFKLNNYHQVGNKYAALYLLKADAIFTVDLSQSTVTISEDNNTLFITLPQPNVKVTINEKSIEKAEEYQRKFFNGNAEDGFDAYLNTMANIPSNAQQSIQNDESLMKTAKDSAEKQIKQITENICINNEKVKIVWD